MNQLNFDKLLNTTIATELGHLNQERKNLRSTKSANTTIDMLTFPLKDEAKTKDIFVQCLNIHEDTFLIKIDRKLYSDLTGKFPYPSSRGNIFAV